MCEGQRIGRLTKEPDSAKCAERSCGEARPASPEPRGGDHRDPEKHGRRIYAHNRIERKAYARGGEDDEYGKPISPSDTGMCILLSHPLDGPVEFDGHTHLLISRV